MSILADVAPYSRESMDEPRQEQVLAATHSARNAVGNARFVTGIRDRVQRFTNQDYPAQLRKGPHIGGPLRTRWCRNS
jgi:hypothetical protein